MKDVHRVEDDTGSKGTDAVRRRDYDVANDVEYHCMGGQIMKGMRKDISLTDDDVRGAAGGDISNLGNHGLSTCD